MNFIEKIVLDKLKKKEKKEEIRQALFLQEFTKGTVTCYDEKTGEYYELVLTDETDKYI